MSVVGKKKSVVENLLEISARARNRRKAARLDQLRKRLQREKGLRLAAKVRECKQEALEQQSGIEDFPTVEQQQQAMEDVQPQPEIIEEPRIPDYSVWLFNEEERKQMLTHPSMTKRTKAMKNLQALLVKFDRVPGGGWLIDSNGHAKMKGLENLHVVIMTAAERVQIIGLEMFLGQFEDDLNMLMK